MNVEAKGLDYRALNEAIRAAGPACRINGCLGQRFIGAGMSGRQVEIHGIPGNALGAYLGGGSITVCVNARLVDDRFGHIAFFGFQIVCRQLIVEIIFDKVSFCAILGKVGINAVNKDIVFTVCFKDVQLLIHVQFGYHRPVELVDLIFFIALDFALGIID